MNNLQTWIAKRISWRRTRRVTVNGEAFVSEEIAAALFKERQQLGRKMLKERARRKAAENLAEERRISIAEGNALIRRWRYTAIAHGYTDEYVERDAAMERTTQKDEGAAS